MCRLDDMSDALFDYVVSRMKDKYIQKGKDECWEWTAHKDNKGYVRIHVYREGNTSYNERAPRIMYSNHYNTILGDLQVLHRCDNPSCVNPKHLFLGTHDDNMKDKKDKGENKR